jgi:23S rRNA pseudouridine1911/1915/1917 synthase
LDVKPEQALDFVVSHEDQDKRLDVFLSSQPLGLSRSRIQALIRDGHLQVNLRPTKPGYRLKTGDRLLLRIPPPQPPPLEPEMVAFEVLREDPSVIFINKPPGLVVHPAPGHSSGTLVHGLLQRYPGLSCVGGVSRPGIVHRLDKDTSGVLVVAKNDRAHQLLSKQFKSGQVRKRYLAIVHGPLKGQSGTIDLPVGRHPKRRKEMAVLLERGRAATTTWEKIEVFDFGLTLLGLTIKTGRTHQIRVHLSHLGFPVAGDPVYGHGKNWWKNHPLCRRGILEPLGRQMLHARSLGLMHPDFDCFMEVEAPLPEDMRSTLEALRGSRPTVGNQKGLDKR